MAQEKLWSKLLDSVQARSWALVVVGVLILLRLRLILLAAALPLVAYWLEVHSTKAEEEVADEAEPEEPEESEPPEDLQDAPEIYDHEFWAEKAKSDSRDLGFSWEGRDELDDLLGRDLDPQQPRGTVKETTDPQDTLDFDFGLGESKGRDLKDFSDLGLGFADREPELDFTGFGMGNGHKGKGKERDGKDSGKGKSKEPREADPKQVFVANIGEAQEDDLRAFFESAGEVERLKVLRHPDGGSKGIGFVTFRTEDQAQKALSFHNRAFEGGHIVVRLAHGGKGKGDREKGEKGGDKGEGRESRGDFFGRDRDRDRDRDKGKGKGRGGKGMGKALGGVEELLEEALAGQEGPLKVSDFDFTAKKFVAELRNRDRADGGSRFQEAMDMILKYTSSKDRSSVRKWPAYVFTLLQKFDPALGEEMRERDQERRQKGSGLRRPRQNVEEDDG